MLITIYKYGAIAQLARAPALQAGGPGFESPLLHQEKALPSGGVFSLVASGIRTPPRVRVKTASDSLQGNLPMATGCQS